MNYVLRRIVRVSTNASIVISDLGLNPGEEVEVLVRPIDENALTLLDVARTVRIDAPPTYSESYQHTVTHSPTSAAQDVRMARSAWMRGSGPHNAEGS